jgi:hypothetical protein
VRSVVLAAIELDRDAVRGPEAVDGPGAEGFDSHRQLDVVLDEQQPEAALEVAALLRGTCFGGARGLAEACADAAPRVRSSSVAPG